MLTELEKKVVCSVQGDIPVCSRPFSEMAENLGISVDKFLQVLTDLKKRNILRRFGATLRHQRSGFEANAMVAWKVDEKEIERIGEEMAEFQEVTHCYYRKSYPEWPYNLYTMVHATTEEKCMETVKELSRCANTKQYMILFSVRELKKTSMKYFL